MMDTEATEITMTDTSGPYPVDIENPDSTGAHAVTEIAAEPQEPVVKKVSPKKALREARKHGRVNQGYKPIRRVGNQRGR